MAQVRIEFTVDTDEQTYVEAIRILQPEVLETLSNALPGEAIGLDLGCILLKIKFSNPSELTRLRSLYDSGKLRNILKDAFNVPAVQHLIGVEDVDIEVDKFTTGERKSVYHFENIGVQTSDTVIWWSLCSV